MAVQTSGESGLYVPYVLASDVVVCPRGAGFPVEEIARVSPRGSTAPRRRSPPGCRCCATPVCDHLIESFSRKNAILGVAIFVPGADFPVLTLNQLRLVLRLAVGARRRGRPVSACRRSSPRSAPGSASVRSRGSCSVRCRLAGWAVKGGVAYAGTRAVGEAARRYFATVAEPAAPRI